MSPFQFWLHCFDWCYESGCRKILKFLNVTFEGRRLAEVCSHSTERQEALVGEVRAVRGLKTLELGTVESQRAENEVSVTSRNLNRT